MLPYKLASKSLSCINFVQLRFSSRSALFVSGRAGSKQFAVFKPKLDMIWIRNNIELLEKVHQQKSSSIHIKSLISELEAYLEMKDKVDEINLNLSEVQQVISERKKEQIEIQDQIKLFKEIKKNLVGLRNAMWNIEEVVLLEYLKLQNCDSKSNLKEKVYYCARRNMDNGNLQVQHKELCNQNNLLEFSNISHSAVYLKSQLAHIEMRLCQYFTSKLLDYGLEIFSNPDFVKSVAAEGCGMDFMDFEKIFSLKKYQDFGDRDSCNAMHLVGGASLPAFVSYFARNVVQTPGVLPVSLFCVGRHYTPITRVNTDLVTCQQSQAVQMFSVTLSYHQMEEQLDRLLDIVINLFSVFPNFSIVEESVKDYETCNSRQFRLEIKVRRFPHICKQLITSLVI